MQKKSTLLILVFILVLAAPLLAVRKSDKPEGPDLPLARETIQGTLINWEPNRPYQEVRLVVAGPDGLVFDGTFEAGFPLVYDLMDLDGNALPDGQYNYELVATPVIGPETRQMMEMSRETGDESIVADLRARGAIPDENSMRLAGTFRIVDGSAVTPDLVEETDGVDDPGSRYRLGSKAPQDFVISDDLIVQSSACIGIDCVNGENFGFDTLRLKENNLRMHWLDTSTSASFPSNDWRLVANDSSNGGGNYFAIEDSTAGRQIARFDAGASANSLRMRSNGNIGLGAPQPVVELHIQDGDSPTVRLDQDGTSGFTPQTWDIAGNEANFFVRDVTNGSRLPFKIFPNAPTNSLTLEGTTGDVGIGTQSPTAPLHVRRTNAAFLVEDTNTTGANFDLMTLQVNAVGGGAGLLLATDDTTWRLNNHNSSNEFRISVTGSGFQELQLDTTGNLTVSGTVTPMSSRTMKENFDSVDVNDVLDRVANLELSTWNYKKDNPEIRHLSPMSEDFREIFQLGKDDRGISVTDLSGVSLAAIQALVQKMQAKDEQIEQLTDRLAALEKALAERQ